MLKCTIERGVVFAQYVHPLPCALDVSKQLLEHTVRERLVRVVMLRCLRKAAREDVPEFRIHAAFLSLCTVCVVGWLF